MPLEFVEPLLLLVNVVGGTNVVGRIESLFESLDDVESLSDFFFDDLLLEIEPEDELIVEVDG